MSTIKIDNLSFTGSELFADSESYLDQLTELSEGDALSIQGGNISIIRTDIPLTTVRLTPTIEKATTPLFLIPIVLL